MADNKDLDSNPPAEDLTIRPLKKIEIAHESESEPELKKQKLKELQRKAYYSVLHASKAENSALSHKKSQIIQRLMKEWKIDQETHVSVAEKIDNSEKNVSSSLNSVPESLVVKRIRARLHDEDCLPSNKKMKLEELHKQAYEDVLNAFNAESPTLSSVNPLLKSYANDSVSTRRKGCVHVLSSFSQGFYPAGCRFLPSDDMMANYYLKNKVLGQPMNARIIPGECPHIFSIPPRDLPGYPIETEWHCYCRKPNGQDPRSLWTRVGEDTTVFGPQGNGVGIKRTYALTDQEKESDDISLPGEIEPPREEWFIEEISLPPSVADTDLVFCHVILNKIEKEEEYEEEEEYDDDEEEE
uniref:NAC domain-containing protein n=1 Tax=Brassica oleracea var. oleracea TaxID=109376 RepID=A0A0D3CU51_BRAOL